MNHFVEREKERRRNSTPQDKRLAGGRLPFGTAVKAKS